MTFSEFLYEFRGYFFMPVMIIVSSIVYKIVKDIKQESYYLDIKDELKRKTDEMIKEKEQKITIDKDLEKYFNYKE